MTIDMEEFRKTDPMVILKEKGRCRASMNLLVRAAVYNTVSYLAVLPLHQIKTFDRETKIRRMARINTTPVEDNG